MTIDDDDVEHIFGMKLCLLLKYFFLLTQLLYLVMFWRNSGSDLLIHKPPIRWSTNDVVQWLTDLGSWTVDYRMEAMRNEIGKCVVMYISRKTDPNRLYS